MMADLVFVSIISFVLLVLCLSCSPMSSSRWSIQRCEYTQHCVRADELLNESTNLNMKEPRQTKNTISFFVSFRHFFSMMNF